MVRKGLLDSDNDLLDGWVGNVRGCRKPEPGNDRGPILHPRVVDVKVPLCRIARREGDAQQALLTSEKNPVSYIEKGHGIRYSVSDDPDDPSLLNDKEPLAAVASMPDEDWEEKPDTYGTRAMPGSSAWTENGKKRAPSTTA